LFSPFEVINYHHVTKLGVVIDGKRIATIDMNESRSSFCDLVLTRRTRSTKPLSIVVDTPSHSHLGFIFVKFEVKRSYTNITNYNISVPPLIMAWHSHFVRRFKLLSFLLATCFVDRNRCVLLDSLSRLEVNCLKCCVVAVKKTAPETWSPRRTPPPDNPCIRHTLSQVNNSSNNNNNNCKPNSNFNNKEWWDNSH